MFKCFYYISTRLKDCEVIVSTVAAVACSGASPSQEYTVSSSTKYQLKPWVARNQCVYRRGPCPDIEPGMRVVVMYTPWCSWIFPSCRYISITRSPFADGVPSRSKVDFESQILPPFLRCFASLLASPATGKDRLRGQGVRLKKTVGRGAS